MKMERIMGLAFAGMLGTLATQSAEAQNLLANPGFETGGFDGWTLSGDGNFEGVSPNFETLPNSGNYSAYFGAVGDYNKISQTIATTPGDTYHIGFALDNSGGPFANMYVDWGCGNDVLDLTPVASFGWTLFGLDVTAAADTTSTTICFAFEQVPSYFNFDDASVTDITQGNTDQNGGSLVYNTNLPTVPDTGAGVWATAATLIGLCAAGYRRRQAIA